MEENVAEWVKVDRGGVAWAVLLRGALPPPACVRNAGIVNRMNGEGPAYRSSARSVALR